MMHSTGKDFNTINPSSGDLLSQPPVMGDYISEDFLQVLEVNLINYNCCLFRNIEKYVKERVNSKRPSPRADD